MAKAEYQVIRPFKYNGRVYQRGEIWTPEGGKFDRQIISMEENKAPPLVTPVERQPTARDIRTQRKKK